MHKKFFWLIFPLYLAAGAAQARVINPLVEPQRNMPNQQLSPQNNFKFNPAQGSQGGIGLPGMPSLPQGMATNPGKMPPVPMAPTFNIPDIKKSLEAELPKELLQFEEKWFISVMSPTAAILRMKDTVTSANAASGGSSTTGSIHKTIYVTSGKIFSFKSYTLEPQIQQGILTIGHRVNGKIISIFESGIDVVAVRRTPQQTKETPMGGSAGATAIASPNSTTNRSLPVSNFGAK